MSRRKKTKATESPASVISKVSLLKRGLIATVIAVALYFVMWALTANAEETTVPVDVVPEVVTEVAAETEEDGFFHRLSAVKDYITRGDTSVLATEVDGDLGARYDEITKREESLVERELMAADRESQLDAKQAKVDAVTNCLVRAMEGGDQ